MTLPNFTAYTDQSWKRWVLFCIATVTIFLLRTLNTDHIEVYDPFNKWMYAVALQHGHYTIPKYTSDTHHHMRWAINLPVAFFCWLFGISTRTYFFTPILAFSIFMVVMLKRSAKEFPWPLVMLFGVLLYIDPMMVRNSTQLHTRLFGTFYMLFCILSLEIKNQRKGVLLSALFLFMAYGAKETYGLFFGPVIGLFVLCKRTRKENILFFGALIILLGIETLVMNQIVTGVRWGGRFEALLEGYHRNKDMLRYIGKFNLWKMVVNPWHKFTIPHMFIAALGFGYAFLSLIIPKLRKELTQFQLLILGCLISYFIGAVFGVLKFTPYIPLQPPGTTYYGVVFPFMYFSVILLIHKTILYARPYIPLRDFTRITYIFIATIAVALAAAFAMQITIFPLIKDKRYSMYSIEYNTAFWTMDDQLLKIAHKIEKGDTLVQRRYQPKFRMRAMVFTLRQTSKEMRNTKQYKWYGYKGQRLFSRVGMKKKEREKCIYLPKPWHVLRMPTERYIKNCPF